MVPSAKTLLRREVRERLAILAAEGRRGADAAICQNLLLLARELGTGVVLGYLALADEVRIDDFLSGALEEGRRVLLPCVRAGSLAFRDWTPSVRLERDGEGVLAPAGPDCPETGNRGSALVVVPGRAFDRRGGRLGRGGGYYDRLLAAGRPDVRFVVGVAYRCQVLDSVPMESHDARVGGVVTESGYSSASGA